jgi:hypothetical protein
MYEFDSNKDDLRSIVPGNRSAILTENNFMGKETVLNTGNEKVDTDNMALNPISRAGKAVVKEGTYTNEEADQLLQQITLLPTTPAPLQILGEALLPIMGYDRFFSGDQFQVEVMPPSAVQDMFGLVVSGRLTRWL